MGLPPTPEYNRYFKTTVSPFWAYDMASTVHRKKFRLLCSNISILSIFHSAFHWGLNPQNDNQRPWQVPNSIRFLIYFWVSFHVLTHQILAKLWLEACLPQLALTKNIIIWKYVTKYFWIFRCNILQGCLAHGITADGGKKEDSLFLPSMWPLLQTPPSPSLSNFKSLYLIHINVIIRLLRKPFINARSKTILGLPTFRRLLYHPSGSSRCAFQRRRFSNYMEFFRRNATAYNVSARHPDTDVEGFGYWNTDRR